MRSQCPAPIWTTALASRPASSPARMPVRASSSTTSRSRGSALARAAAISLAASRSSRNFGSGSGFFGMSPAMTGLRGGASGQSHSMIRSKNARTVRIRCRCVSAVIDLAAGPGLGGEPYLVVLDVIAAHRGDAVQPGVGDHPPGELAQRVLRGVDAGRGQERGQALQIPLDRRRRLRRRGPDLRPLRGGDAAGHRPAGGGPAGGQRAHRTAASCTASISATAAVSASISSAARRYSVASQSLARCR